ncbi:MAG: TonB-dependent receptor [Robiginitomaculum sp.]|nr:TonB-dependent receptor [Robiginitomaculum sp.]
MSIKKKTCRSLLLKALCTTALSSIFVASNAHAQLDEIIVTATKRTENLQDAAIAVQAISQQTLSEQRITSFDDYIELLSNVTFSGRGPGQNTFNIRGAGIQTLDISVAESQGTGPNVALYLDEQPVTAGGRNLDIYLADIERVEVLPGPQGTLYGASSQAGTIRFITNKPKFNEFSGRLDASYAFTDGGNDSTALVGTVNIPIIEDRLAVRFTAFNDRKGGYIDNVLGTFTPSSANNPSLPSDAGVFFAAGTTLADGTVLAADTTFPVVYEETSNSELVQDNFNEARYSGFRFGVNLAINDDWSLLVQHHRQTLDVDGVFDYDPEVGELQVSRFAPDTLEDKFGTTSWTLTGRLAGLDAVYTGSYLNRDVEQTISYAQYSDAGRFIPGYICEYNTPGYTGAAGGYGFDPTLSGDPAVIECRGSNNFIRTTNENERLVNEFRVSGNLTDWSSFLLGVYHEDNEIRHVGDFFYSDARGAPIDPGQLNGGTGPLTANNPNVRDPRVQFTNDITRPEEQFAIFGEVAFDIGDKFNIAFGGRYYWLDVGFQGFSAFVFGNDPAPNLAGLPGVTTNPNVTGGRDFEVTIPALGADNPDQTNDFIPRVTLTYEPNDDILLFATYSEGFRPAGFNRATASGFGAATGNGTTIFPDFFIPLVFESDTITNYEFGWKTQLLNNRLRINGSVYFTEWDDIQIGAFDSQNISLFGFIDNAGDAEIRGIETDFAFALTDNFLWSGNASYIKTELVRANPALGFILVPAGSELPLTPNLQFSTTGRYEKDAYGGLAHAQVTLKYAGDSFSSLETSEREVQGAYALLDGSIGYSSDSDGWQVELFVDNITNAVPDLNIQTFDNQRRITTARPRTIGIRVGKDF